ncbi:Uncharacterised protein [Klebsiella pneumoniae]|uniref:Uncharacterized protein n=1 Tax=Klebsiella pneumoniae TaxID=573 RepID=A0A377TKE3_KLEPN|nr:Uncharacterised protein [Klebsiella pneumoniae]
MFPPTFRALELNKRQQRCVWAASLNGIQQSLVTEVAQENVPLMLLQLSIEIDAIGGYVDFFRAPEEGELFSISFSKSRYFC